MNKYYGNLGFYEQVETVPGVWKDTIVERPYYGDIERSGYSYRVKDKVNTDININVSLSVLIDTYAYSNYNNLRYVEWNNVKWRVESIDVQYPRLILNLGGEYVGD